LDHFAQSSVMGFEVVGISRNAVCNTPSPSARNPPPRLRAEPTKSGNSASCRPSWPRGDPLAGRQEAGLADLRGLSGLSYPTMGKVCI
jgi:hypothetical protein